MATVFQFPGGRPRYYLDDDGIGVYEYGTTPPKRAFYIDTDTRVVHALDGAPAYDIGEDGYWHAYDGSHPVLYFGENYPFVATEMTDKDRAIIARARARPHGTAGKARWR